MSVRRMLMIGIGFAWPAAFAAAQPVQDVLSPAGPQAAHIAHLWWLMLVVCAGVFVAVMAALAVALWKSTRPARPDDPARNAQRREATTQWSVIAAVTASVVLLLGLVVASMGTDRALAQLPLQDAVNITMNAHQWWWEIRYDDGEPSHVFSTANEMHIPVGRPVIVTLQAADVIHSFWVPNLHGKKDLIPGHTSVIELRADRAGTYRGQCAEFCGYQHAYMAFDVVAESPADYERWLERQRAPAKAPSDPMAQHGQAVFLASTCAMCHAVVGTQAGGQRAPDLTHLASRRTLGAGTVPNTPSQLAAWVLDAPRIKPGVIMPPNPLTGDDLRDLIAYLDTLE